MYAQRAENYKKRAEHVQVADLYSVCSVIIKWQLPGTWWSSGGVGEKENCWKERHNSCLRAKDLHDGLADSEVVVHCSTVQPLKENLSCI